MPLTIVPRVPYVPIEPWQWFQENGIEGTMIFTEQM